MLKKIRKIFIDIIKFSFVLIVFILFFLSQVTELGTVWAMKNYNYSSFDEILYTLGTSVTTASKSVVEDFFQTNVYPPLQTTLILFLVFVFLFIIYKILFKNIKVNFKIQFFQKKFTISLNIMMAIFLFFMSITFFMTKTSIAFAMDSLYIDKYIDSNLKTSSFFKDNYVNPENVSLEFPKEKRNLIYIYLESMESTYTDLSHGGAYSDNYIPNLTSLANKYTNFSNTDNVGGAYMVTGTTWTMGGIIAESAGIPIKNVFGANDERSYEYSFVSGAISLGDILKKEGYNQSIMVGSDLEFGGRKAYFTEHGNYNVYDYYTAIDEGVIDDDYYVFWGLEDEKLYNWAKDKLLEISEKDEPFNFTMLTVDTHAPDGYTSDFCPNYSQDSYLNSIYCSDMQLKSFIEWIQEQDFYDNTTIVLIGDHISMNNYSFDDIPDDYDRRVYNVYINSDVDTDNNKNREFTTFDYYPTTLASLGVEIKGDKLGLGTNLFSDKKTLSEKYGNDYINNELSKRSTYYDACINFSQCK